MVYIQTSIRPQECDACDFLGYETEKYHLIPVRRPDPLIINKKENRPYSKFCGLTWPQKKQKERQVLRPYQETKEAVKHEVYGDINYKWCAWNWPKHLGRRMEEMKIRRRIEVIESLLVMRAVRILRRDMNSVSDSSEGPLTNAGRNACKEHNDIEEAITRSHDAT